jgi:hypothetical protein
VTTNAYKKSPSATSKEAVDLTREQHPNRGAQEQFAEPLLTEKQAAAYLNMVVKTLQNWRWRGDGPPFVKLGDLVRYRRRDLDELILANLRTSTSDAGEAR